MEIDTREPVGASPNQSQMSSPSNRGSAIKAKGRGSIGSAAMRGTGNIFAAADKMSGVKSAFAERAVYKDMMKAEGVEIEEDKSFNRGAEPVRERRNRSSIAGGNILVQRKAILKEYFIGAVSRNPFTGLVYLSKVEHSFDFTIVDLFDRDYVMGSPESLSSDMYLFRPVPLAYRTWVYHKIIWLQEMALRDMNVYGAQEYAGLVKADLLKVALAFNLIDENTNAFGRYSPFQPASIAMVLMCFTVDIPLMIWAFYLFMVTFAATTYANHPKLFRWHRFLSFPFRLPVTIVVTAHLGQISVYASQGKWVSVASILLAWLILMGDHTMGDLANLSAFGVEKGFEIERILPGGVYLCSTKGGDSVAENMPRSAIDEINPDLVGADYLGISKKMLRNCILVVDVQGILCELKPCSLAQWREHMRLGRHILSCFSTRTFSNLRPDGDFFQKDGTFRNLYEIMGLRNDGTFMEENVNDRRRSFLGRRGTYQVTAPLGVPGEPSSVPPPPTEPPPSLSHTAEKAQVPKAQLPHKDNLSEASGDHQPRRGSRPQSAPVGQASRTSTKNPTSGGAERPQSAVTTRRSKSGPRDE